MKEQIKSLQIGKTLSVPTTDKAEIQRIRNHCHTIKGARYRTRYSDGVLTITRLDPISSDFTLHRMRDMNTGDVLHIGSKKDLNSIKSMAQMLDGEYRVGLVVEVERVK